MTVSKPREEAGGLADACGRDGPGTGLAGYKAAEPGGAARVPPIEKLFDGPAPALVRDCLMVLKAKQILRANDMGGWTKAAPGLYPHQWSWDSALIAIGIARLDFSRAATELETLFAHQWRTGKVPHIVFNEDAPPESYFPGPDHWACAARSPDAPSAPPYTSCLIQPPVHAIAAHRIWEIASRADADREAARAFLGRLYPKLLAWHRYLMTHRDREGSGLVTIYHPWESGTDNSPRWDAALERVEPGEMPGFVRRDLQHVEDPSERPTDAEYRRYIWLVESIKRAGCDEDRVYASQQFQVKDVLASAILVTANEALLEIGHTIDAPQEELALVETWVSRGRSGLETLWNEDLGLYLDHDVRADEPLKARTVAGLLAPLVAGHLKADRFEALAERLHSPEFLGHPDLYRPLPPSTSPRDSGFKRHSYWRGPFWPVVTWLLWWSLERAGGRGRAARLRRTALDQISENGFAEYFDPFTGESLGADDQSWTAAVVLDWLCAPKSGPETAS